MEILSKKETKKLKSVSRGIHGVRSPIRDAFNNLGVGQSIVFTSTEWNEFYKSHPAAVARAWCSHKGWNISCRKVKNERVALLKIRTWALIRTK